MNSSQTEGSIENGRDTLRSVTAQEVSLSDNSKLGQEQAGKTSSMEPINLKRMGLGEELPDGLRGSPFSEPFMCENDSRNTHDRFRHDTAKEKLLIGTEERFSLMKAKEKPFKKQCHKRPKAHQCSLRRSLSTMRYLYFSYFQDWWAFEILSILFSLACLVAIVVILLIYGERPLSVWVMPISINSLISWFAALSKSAMLFTLAACIGQLKWLHFAKSSHSLMMVQRFDDASRGPLGALGLMLQLGNGSLTALFGSLLTFAALVVDPFAQQIVSYPSRHVPDVNNTATIAATQVYDTSASDSGGSSTCSDDETSGSLSLADCSAAISTDLEMQGAIYRGFYSLPAQIPSQCPSGNCEWPDFVSLGVCSSCANVTPKTQRSCFISGRNGQPVTKLPQSEPQSLNFPMACNYTTPRQFNLWARFPSPVIGENGNIDALTVINSTALRTNPFDFSGIELASLAILRLPDYLTNFEAPFGEIHECQLFWCAKKYSNVRVVDGALQGGKEDGLRLEFPDQAFSSGPYIPYKIRNRPPDYHLNDTFSINTQPLMPIISFLEKVLTVSMVSSSEPDQQGICIGSALRQRNNMTQLMESLANSMSDRVRSGPNATHIVGSMYQLVTFIHVNWIWLILPVMLVIWACGLLVLLIVSTSKPDSVLWKSSPLALLFHRLENLEATSSPPTADANSQDEDAADAKRPMMKLSEMETIAEGLSAQLLRDSPQGELKFVADLGQ